MRELEDAVMFCPNRDASLECIACVHAYKIVATARLLIQAGKTGEAYAVWAHYINLFGQWYGDEGLCELNKFLDEAMIEVLRDRIETEVFIETSRN